MKKLQLVTSISLLCLAFTAQSSIELFNKDGHKVSLRGRVKAANYIGDRENKIDGEGDKTKARLGFDGQTKVTDSITGYGRAEWETKTNNSTIDNRYAFAGIKLNQFGSIDYGRNDGIVKSLVSYTDVLPEFGGNAGNASTYLLSKRTSAVLTYRNNDLMDGLRIGAQYADNSSETKIGSARTGREAYGLSIDYSILDTGLSIAAVYAQTAQNNPFKTWATGLKYDQNNVYLAALYIASQQSENNKKTKYSGYEFVAQYGIDMSIGRMTPSIAYILHQDKSDNINNGNLVKYIEVGTTYDFNKNLKLVADYKINLLDTDDRGAKKLESNTKNVLGLALTYQF